jgi:hypothetical protein
LWGEQPSSAAWGEPSRPGFPRRGNGKGGLISLLPQADCLAPFAFESFAQSMIHLLRHCFSPDRRDALLPFALSIGVGCSGAFWCPHSSIGRCHLRTELKRPVSVTSVPGTVRSRPNPAIFYKNTNSELKLLLSSNPIFVRRYAAAHTLRRSPTGDAAAPPASVPPPQLPASSHSSRHARPV